MYIYVCRYVYACVCVCIYVYMYIYIYNYVQRQEHICGRALYKSVIIIIIITDKKVLATEYRLHCARRGLDKNIVSAHPNRPHRQEVRSWVAPICRWHPAICVLQDQVTHHTVGSSEHMQRPWVSQHKAEDLRRPGVFCCSPSCLE